MNRAQWKTLLPTLKQIKDAADTIHDTQGDVEAVRDEEQEKLDNMPESLRNAEKGEKIEAIVEALTTIADFDIQSLIDAIDDVEGQQ